jgi:hypothetical protein
MYGNTTGGALHVSASLFEAMDVFESRFINNRLISLMHPMHPQGIG